MDRLNLQVPAERVGRDDIDERSQRGRDAHAVDCLHVLVAEPSAAEAEHRRNGGHALETGGHGHVQSAGHYVRELV